MYLTVISGCGAIHYDFCESNPDSLNADIALVMAGYAKGSEQDAHDHGYSKVVMMAVPETNDKIEGFIYRQGLQVRLYQNKPLYDNNGNVFPSYWIEKQGLKLAEFMLLEPEED